TGTPPFTGDTSQEIMDKQIEQPVPFVQSVNENVPEKLSTYLVRLLAKSPDKRPESWSQVIKELEKNRKSQRKSHVASAPGARSFSQPNSVRKFSSHRNYQAQRQTSADIREKKKRTKTQKQITLLLLLLIVLATGLYLLDSLPMAEKDDEKEDDTRRAENVEEDSSEDKTEQEDSDSSGEQEEAEAWREKDEETDDASEQEDEEAENKIPGRQREDEDPDDEVDEAREGADTSLDWRARSRYRNLIRDISRSELSVLQAPPAISQQIDDWLNYVGDSGAETDEVKAVIFLQDTVVPALDKVHETLVQQGEILTDHDLEIEGLEGKTLKEIKEKGLMVSEEVETGENQRGRVAQLMKWQEIDEPEYIFPIVEQLLTGSDADDLGVDEARALLGYSLLSIKKPGSFDNRKNVYEVIIDYLDKPDVTIPDAEKEKWRDLADVFR
ncbi:MAG: hypothetical protein ACOCQP_03100, partial [Lentisphaeria bacterium]